VMMNRKYLLSALAMVGMVVSTEVRADEHSGFYAGTGIGVVTNKVDEFDSDGVAVKFFGGYTFNQYFAAEAAYIYAGTLEDTVEDIDIEVKPRGTVIAALGKLPVNDAFSLFAKLGYTFYDEKVTGSRGDIRVTEKNSGDDLLYGIGTELRLGRIFQLRAEYEVVDVSNGDFNLLSASAVFRF
jgi:OOP family OmpA-OmpF porin